MFLSFLERIPMHLSDAKLHKNVVNANIAFFFSFFVLLMSRYRVLKQKGIKKAMTFSGDRFESSIGISFF